MVCENMKEERKIKIDKRSEKNKDKLKDLKVLTIQSCMKYK